MDPGLKRKLRQRFSQLISTSEDAVDDLLNAMARHVEYNKALTRSVIQTALRMGVGTELINDALGGIAIDSNLRRPRPLAIEGIDPAPIVAEVQLCARALADSEELLKRAVACSTGWRTSAGTMRSMVALRLSPRRAVSSASTITVEERQPTTLL